jgi:hypothetical protein
MEITQAGENSKEFEVILVFKNDKIRFSCNLLARNWLKAGNYTITAPPDDWGEYDRTSKALFYIDEDK